jgi:tetratricopeptide (TPR) repeat protein
MTPTIPKGGIGRRISVVPLAASILTLLIATGAACQAPRLGETSFPTSGSPEAQEHFLEGVLWLHSFEYDRAATAFREAQRVDPDFAMAYWGEAMTYNHPVWFEQDRGAARSALERLAPTPEARLAAAPTERERAYLKAVEVLYGEGEKASRDTLYAEAMRELREAYPDDENAAAFYALALLGTSHGGRDVPTYIRAGAVAEEVFARNPDHPGAAHYLIHSYDDPVHAPLGLRAARAYSGIAPDAAHAQHMTSHIFVALGMWDEVVAQNEIAAGHDRGHWSPGHYTAWLLYGYLQQGRHERALEHLEAMHEDVSGSGMQAAVLARMRADYVVNTEEWESPALAWALEPDRSHLGLVASDVFARGMAALESGEREEADRAVAELASLGEAAGKEADPNDPAATVIEILEMELRGLARVAEGAQEDGVALLREAAALEDVMPFEFGPPAVVKPTHELLGDVLMELGRTDEAQREYARALELTPLRARSLLGLGRAAAATGDSRTAGRAYAQLREIWHGADPALPGLEEAARYAAVR